MRGNASTKGRWWAVLLLALGFLSASRVAPAAAQATAGSNPGAGEGRGLTLEQVFALARQRSPLLHAAQALADAAEARQASAGLPPDPMLQLGFMNLSLPGLDADMPASMAPSVQVMQMLPLFGKLGLSSRIAEQSTGMAQADAAETWWSVRTRAAMAFYEMYEADRQIEVMRRTLRLLEDFEEIAHAMYAAGDGAQTDVLRAGVESARMRADITRMETMRSAAAARLRAVIDLPADGELDAPILSPMPLALPTADTLYGWAAASRPMLERGRTGVEQARTRGRLARREIWPDPVVGVQYGQRNGEMGTERMGSVMLGFSIPVFARNRQMRMRDEASAMEAMASAELNEMQAQVGARIAELLADLSRSRTLVELYRADILPQANASVESALASYRVGRVDFMTLVDAQMDANRYERELIALIAGYGRAIADLEMTVGRELPLTGPVLVEAA